MKQTYERHVHAYVELHASVALVAAYNCFEQRWDKIIENLIYGRLVFLFPVYMYSV